VSDAYGRDRGVLAHASRWLLPAAGLALAVALWWVGTVAIGRGFITRFAPEHTFAALIGLIESGALWPHLFASLRRVLLGLVLSALIGFPLGLLLGRSQVFARASGAVFQFLRMISPLAWTPLAIILLGVGDPPVYFLIAIGCVWPIALNTAAGVAALEPRWLTLARSLGATRLEAARAIVWPGIRAHVLTGGRLAVGLAWIILVPAEMLGVDSGLGYYILDTRDRFAYGELMAAILVVGFTGFLIDVAARRILREPVRASGARRSGATTPLQREVSSGEATSTPVSAEELRPIAR